SHCTSTIESAVYENRTYGAVRGRRLITASYSILGYAFFTAPYFIQIGFYCMVYRISTIMAVR
ncbi:MAG: hypothetical protein ACOX8H_09245, partial [Ruminococcus sp.]